MPFEIAVPLPYFKGMAHSTPFVVFFSTITATLVT